MITPEIKKLILELTPYYTNNAICTYMDTYPTYIHKYVGKLGKRKIKAVVKIADHKDKLDKLVYLYAATNRKNCINDGENLVKLSEQQSLINSQRHMVEHLHNPFCKLSFMM